MSRDFVECVDYIETNIKRGWGMPPEIHKDVALLIRCIREQQDALRQLHSAAENMRHGGFRDGVVASYDGWAREANATLSKWKLP